MSKRRLFAASLVVCALQACGQAPADEAEPDDTAPDPVPADGALAGAPGGAAGTQPMDVVVDTGSGSARVDAGAGGPVAGATPVEPALPQGPGKPNDPFVPLPPVSVDLAQLPYLGQVSGEGTPNFVRLTGLTTGTTYVATARSQAAPLRFDTRYTYCSTVDSEDVARYAFTADASSHELRIVTDTIEPVGFELEVEIAATQAEGTAAMPVTLTPAELPYSGTAICASPNRYVIAGLDPEQRWLVSLTSLERVFLRTLHAADGSLDCEDQTETGLDARCQTLEPASSVELSIVAHGMSERGFTFDIRPVSYANEGTRDEPVELALDDMPHAGSVARKGESVYLVTGLVPGTTYDVGVSDLEEDFVLHVMKPGTRQGLCSLSTDNESPLLPIRCASTPDDSAVQIEIQGLDNAGTSYSLSVVPR